MDLIGRKLYYDKNTGNVILDTGEQAGSVVKSTKEQDIATYKVLAERMPDSFDVIQLGYGEFTYEFATATAYRVNPVNKIVEFVYTDKLETLEDFQTMKIEILNRACETAIEAGFVSLVNSHTYRTNRDDQINFMGQKDDLDSDPTIEVVYWKTEDAGYLPHPREEWLAIFKEGLAHKRSLLFKNNELKMKVLAAKTKEEVDAINWNEAVETTPEEPAEVVEETPEA